MSSATPGGRCGLCSKPGTKYRCGSCKVVHYCSPECQRTHWTKGHKGQCQVLRSNETTQHLLPASSASASASIPSPTPKPTQTQSQTPKKAIPLPSPNLPTAKTTTTKGGGGDFLFPSSKFQELMSFKPDIFPGSGIRNVGNTCR
jgi:ubiquitin carboxyl-terminal hydrolase 36/42